MIACEAGGHCTARPHTATQTKPSPERAAMRLPWVPAFVHCPRSAIRAHHAPAKPQQRGLLSTYTGLTDAGWSSSVARWAHNPEVVSSNLAPATQSGPVHTKT